MKKMIIGIIIGVIMLGTVGVLASTIISSTNVTYQDKTVNTALDELYNDVITGKNLVASAITAQGISTTANANFSTMTANIAAITKKNLSLQLLGTGNSFRAVLNDYYLIVIVTEDGVTPSISGGQVIGGIVKTEPFTGWSTWIAFIKATSTTIRCNNGTSYNRNFHIISN